MRNIQMPKPAHGKREMGNGKTGQAGATQPPHPESSVRSSFFFYFVFCILYFIFLVCILLTARPGFPAYIHTGEVESHAHAHAHAKNADGMYCRMWMWMWMWIGHAVRQGHWARNAGR